jgi:hypothetical protein
LPTGFAQFVDDCEAIIPGELEQDIARELSHMQMMSTFDRTPLITDIKKVPVGLDTGY